MDNYVKGWCNNKSCTRHHIRENGAKLILVDSYANLSKIYHGDKNDGGSTKLPSNCEMYIIDRQQWPTSYTSLFRFVDSTSIFVGRAVGLDCRTRLPPGFAPRLIDAFGQLHQEFNMVSFGPIGISEHNPAPYDLGSMLAATQDIVGPRVVPILIHCSQSRIATCHESLKQTKRKGPITWHTSSADGLDRAQPTGPRNDCIINDLGDLLRHSIDYSGTYLGTPYSGSSHAPGFDIALLPMMGGRVLPASNMPFSRPDIVPNGADHAYTCALISLQYWWTRTSNRAYDVRNETFAQTHARLVTNFFRIHPRAVFQGFPEAAYEMRVTELMTPIMTEFGPQLAALESQRKTDAAKERTTRAATKKANALISAVPPANPTLTPIEKATTPASYAAPPARMSAPEQGSTMAATAAYLAQQIVDIRAQFEKEKTELAATYKSQRKKDREDEKRRGLARDQQARADAAATAKTLEAKKQTDEALDFSRNFVRLLNNEKKRDKKTIAKLQLELSAPRSSQHDTSSDISLPYFNRNWEIESSSSRDSFHPCASPGTWDAKFRIPKRKPASDLSTLQQSNLFDTKTVAFGQHAKRSKTTTDTCSTRSNSPIYMGHHHTVASFATTSKESDTHRTKQTRGVNSRSTFASNCTAAATCLLKGTSCRSEFAPTSKRSATTTRTEHRSRPPTVDELLADITQASSSDDDELPLLNRTTAGITAGPTDSGPSVSAFLSGIIAKQDKVALAPGLPQRKGPSAPITTPAKTAVHCTFDPELGVGFHGTHSFLEELTETNHSTNHNAIGSISPIEKNASHGINAKSNKPANLGSTVPDTP